MKDDRGIFTLDSDTIASNPGRVKVMPLVLMRYMYKPVFLLIALLASLVFALSISLIIGGVAFFILFFVNMIYWRRKKEQFAHGDSNGGIIISENPKLVAVTTDLTKGFAGSYPVVKVIPYRGKAKLNERIGTVSLYEGSESCSPHWKNFFPVPVEYVNNNKAELHAVLKSYSDESWQVLENRIKEIKKPYKEGLFKIFNENSQW
ncbi:Protein of unknown function [Chryseobacterium arachidis]|uniref:DUF3239 domain-containing protein n=1 Tax=Chryseobacterium arachidis TaxID=1416778 RepID=A0A1M4Z1Q3_9FLAO|nr:DUF3239 domain-containing protein [Chryseobacterium arachidis]SHF11506.1 Protein of unknown function [Chryseobacterium arachidis]